jgi:hypothetical protein
MCFKWHDGRDVLMFMFVGMMELSFHVLPNS